LSNTNRSFEGKENKNETLNGVNSDTDKLNLSLQLPSVENKPKRRLTAINAALNLGSAKLPKKQLQIERLKIKNMDPEEKAKLFDECNKQDEIIKMEYSQATAKTKEKKQKKTNIRLDSHESSSENLNSKKRRRSTSESLPDLLGSLTNLNQLNDNDSGKLVSESNSSLADFDDEDDDKFDGPKAARHMMDLTMEIEKNLNEMNKKNDIYENITFIVNSNEKILTNQYNLIKYTLERLIENYKQQRFKSNKKVLDISIHDISSNVSKMK
jgi:hypothetical protein